MTIKLLSLPRFLFWMDDSLTLPKTPLMYRYLLVIFTTTICFVSLRAQSLYDIAITAKFDEVQIPAVLAELERKAGVHIYYHPDLIPAYKVSFDFQKSSLKVALQQVLEGSNMRFTNIGNDKIVIGPKDQMNSAYLVDLVAGWESGKYQSPLLMDLLEKNLIIGETGARVSGSKLLIKGEIKDYSTEEAIVGATVFVRETGDGTATDENGKFNLKVPTGTWSLLIEYIGYQSVLVKLTANDDGNMTIVLNPNPLQLTEVLVKGEAVQRSTNSTNLGLEKLDVKVMRELPSLLGESDVVKSLLYLPGVSTVGEGSGGFNVRGGNIDQNLVMQDGMPLFNASHALGFFSVFNADAVDNVTLYKGHIPAQYGGRLSSVLDVGLKDGNRFGWHGNGSVGVISSKAVLEGPIIKDKLSILVGGRGSYIGYILPQVRNRSVARSATRFNDQLAKITWRISPKATFRVLGVNTYDYFRYDNEFGYDWQNQQLGASLDLIHNSHFSTSVSVSGVRYKASLFDPEGNDAFSLISGIDNYKAKIENLLLTGQDKHSLRFGVEANLFDTAPEQLEPKEGATAVLPKKVERGGGREFGFFVQDEWKFNPRISISVGLRYSLFQQTGPVTVYNYEPNAPKEDETVVGEETFSASDVVKSYQGFEPRASVKYSFDEYTSVKGSYNLLRQYVHLISNTAAPTPVDLWQVSGPYLPPQVADQYSLGIYKNTENTMWEYSLEGYFKKIKNQPEYKDLPDLLLNERLETELLQGKGRTWGAEVSIRKATGKWTGWVSYTFSRAEVQVNGTYPSETINGGKWYPSGFDKPHQLSVVGRCQINPRNIFNFNFTYNSGRPITVPLNYYSINGVVIPNYSERNSFRIKDYHRLDLAYTIDNSKAKVKGWRGSLTFSVYNIYARKNPFSVFFKRNNNERVSAYELSVLGTVMPAMTYNFTF